MPSTSLYSAYVACYVVYPQCVHVYVACYAVYPSILSVIVFVSPLSSIHASSQVTGIVLVLIGQALQFELPLSQQSHSQCGLEASNTSQLLCLRDANSSSTDYSAEPPQNFEHALLFYAGLGVLVLMLLTFGFRPTYERLEMEKRANALSKLQFGSASSSSIGSERSTVTGTTLLDKFRLSSSTLFLGSRSETDTSSTKL